MFTGVKDLFYYLRVSSILRTGSSVSRPSSSVRLRVGCVKDDGLGRSLSVCTKAKDSTDSVK